jgi:hypothetical protein
MSVGPAALPTNPPVQPGAPAQADAQSIPTQGAPTGSEGPVGPGAGSAEPGARRWLRRRRLLRSAAGLLVVVFVLATAKLFVFPRRDTPVRADAIVMFAGSVGRLELAVSLARAGYAPVLAVSQPTPHDPCPPDTIPNVEVICFNPQPLTTQGESRWTAQAAAAHGWHSLLVITATTQDTRARLRLSRCYHGDVQVVTVDPVTRAAWAYMVTYEWGALVKALVLQRTC